MMYKLVAEKKKETISLPVKLAFFRIVYFETKIANSTHKDPF